MRFLGNFAAYVVFALVLMLGDCWWHHISPVILIQHWFPLTWTVFGSAVLAALIPID